MSILSTNQKLIKVGQDYSAGENIGIYEHTISSRNWSPDITYAAESAFQRATGYTDTQISALSSEVSAEVSQLGSDIQYISGVALTAHQSLDGYLTKASGDEYYQPIGSYATVSQLESTSGEIVNLIPTDYVNTETLEQTSGNIVNLIPDTSEFITNVSAEQTYQPIGNYLSSNALEGYATQDWVGEQGYITGVSIPESATWNDVSTTVQTNSAQWAEGGGTGGDPEVNEFVYNNSATINEVNTSYQTNSGDFLTAAPADMATTGDVAELAQTISETYQVKGDYLTNADSANFYPANNPSGFITGVDLSNFYTKDETSGKEELSNAFANVPTPDYEVESYIHNNSASLDGTTNVVQSNSSVWSDITAYQSNSASYLTGVSIPESGNWNEATTTVQTNSSTWDNVSNKLDTTSFSDVSSTFLTAVDLTPYQTTAGMTAYQPVGDYATTADLALKQDTLTFDYDEQDRISAINNSAIAAGDEFPVSADEAIQYVQTNSANIDDTVTSYQTNSSTYMVEPNLEYNAVNEISGYNGSAIAQYGAEKQWLQHDDTIVHVSNSAQYAFGCNISALQRLMGIDETVLWTNPSPSMIDQNTTLTAQLSDTISSYKILRFVCKASYDYQESFCAAVQPVDFYTNENNVLNKVGIYLPNRNGSTEYTDNCSIMFSGSTFTASFGKRNQSTTNTGRGPYILSAIGIGRRS